MPFYATGSVKQLMSGRYLTVREIIRLATQFLTGLHNIHSKGLIHFDIKPDNILLSDSYEAMLSDFGLARRMDSFGVAENSRNYMKQRPPEAFTGDNQFTRAFDIYQVGMALYRMCNGDDWFNTQLNSYFIDERFDRQRFCNDVLSGSFPNRSKFLHHIPDSLRNVVKRCLQVQPEERYRSVIELLNDLAKIDCNELDWQFERNNNERRWILRDDNRVISLTVDASNNSVASKITAKRNNRITNYCLTPITDHKIRAFLRQRH
jgi:serine/threonine protein kinase